MLIVIAAMFVLPAKASYDLPETEKIVYGYSGEGRALEAYRYGNGKNVLVMTYALHGWEDNWNQDGLALVKTAQQVMSHLESSYLPDSYDWTVYILPCCNPDGLYSGNTCNGPGRCTTTYYISSGILSSKHGVDMNRSFPSGFYTRTSTRNYTGSSALACKESRALATFIQNVKGADVNILIDVHGWYQQIISVSSRLQRVFQKYFPNNSRDYEVGAGGYLTRYADSLGYETCLLELPDGYYSLSSYLNSSCIQKVINSVDDIMKTVNLTCPGHNYVYTSTAATCTTAGTVTQTCSNCGKTKTYAEAALGHIRDTSSAVILSQPTASQNGLEQYKCSRCGAALTGVISRIFRDVSGTAYYASALDMCYDAGYIKGTSATTFSPDETLNRAMLVTILYRLHGEPMVDCQLPFTDIVAGAYYENALKWAYTGGIIQGVSATEFSPNKTVTRQEAMTIFFRYASMLGKDNGLRDSGNFGDLYLLADYAQEAAQWSVANGIIIGNEHGMLMPADGTTRAQSVVIIQRMQNYIDTYVEPEPSEPEPSEPEPSEPESSELEPTEPETEESTEETTPDETESTLPSL